eukprot:scaffold268_cov236-Pinguiococcus_pyrenoidosus.AAC.31
MRSLRLSQGITGPPSSSSPMRRLMPSSSCFASPSTRIRPSVLTPPMMPCTSLRTSLQASPLGLLPLARHVNLLDLHGGVATKVLSIHHGVTFRTLSKVVKGCLFALIAVWAQRSDRGGDASRAIALFFRLAFVRGGLVCRTPAEEAPTPSLLRAGPTAHEPAGSHRASGAARHEKPRRGLQRTRRTTPLVQLTNRTYAQER